MENVPAEITQRVHVGGIREGCGKGNSINCHCCLPFPSCFVGKTVVAMVMVVAAVLEYYLFEIRVVMGRHI